MLACRTFFKAFTLSVICLYSQFKTAAQVYGCTDPAAQNYNTVATINDGSCQYKKTALNPVLISNIATALNETSGLLWWNQFVWTHNDSGGQPAIYAINNTGAIVKTVSITNATNIDWEDMTQDNTYLYIGDFGNNSNGNRTDLKIYRIKKSDVKSKTAVTASVIKFSYSDQTDFTPKGGNNTNFDCESIIAYGDSLFLFSKNWIDNKTRLYKLPKTPGTHTAVKMAELNVQGLITGAEIVADKKVIVLTGYNAALTPFVYLLYDFSGNNFFGGNKRKVDINQTLLQMEGICKINARKFYISNERVQKVVTVPAKLQTINLGPLLNPYYNKSTLQIKQEIVVAVDSANQEGFYSKNVHIAEH